MARIPKIVCLISVTGSHATFCCHRRRVVESPPATTAEPNGFCENSDLAQGLLADQPPRLPEPEAPEAPSELGDVLALPGVQENLYGDKFRQGAGPGFLDRWGPLRGATCAVPTLDLKYEAGKFHALSPEQKAKSKRTKIADVMLNAFKLDPTNIQYVSPALRQNVGFMLQVVEEALVLEKALPVVEEASRKLKPLGSVLAMLNSTDTKERPSLKHDRRFMLGLLKAVGKYSDYLYPHIGKELKEDREFVIAAAQIDAKWLRPEAGFTWTAETFLDLMEQTPEALRYPRGMEGRVVDQAVQELIACNPDEDNDPDPTFDPREDEENMRTLIKYLRGGKFESIREDIKKKAENVRYMRGVEAELNGDYSRAMRSGGSIRDFNF